MGLPGGVIFRRVRGRVIALNADRVLRLQETMMKIDKVQNEKTKILNAVSHMSKPAPAQKFGNRLLKRITKNLELSLVIRKAKRDLGF